MILQALSDYMIVSGSVVDKQQQNIYDTRIDKT